ncbi:MAG: hypothetical protein O3B01_30910 [Planctomycetota bacterium]|nr:hypothetical protein [Planctomycetota bacterium]MDA1142993.1 hypothetical protein [Planctomycetota bacterium]
MDLIKNGETKAVVTVHLGGEPAVQAARILIKKFQEKTGVELELRQVVGFDDITRCLQMSLSTSAGYEFEGEELTTPDLQGRESVPPEGFVADLAEIGSDIGVVLSADTLGDLVNAAGEILRGIEYGKKDVRLCRLPPKIFVAKKPVRGIYLTMHAGSEIASWPEEKLRRLFEDWAIWGYNTVVIQHDMQAYRSDFKVNKNTPGSKALARLQLMSQIAADLGLKFGLATVANDAYIDRARVSLRAEVSTEDIRRGGSSTLLCPSQHQGRAYLLEDREELFRDLKPIDALWIWPYNPGGCWCERCDPWIKTFLGLAQEMARVGKRYHNRAKAYVSTRWFRDDEFDILEEFLGTDPDWLDGIVLDKSDPFGEWRTIEKLTELAKRFSPSVPILFGPEISLSPFAVGENNICFDNGRLGANPELKRLYGELNQLDEYISGVIAISETIADDINKTAAVQWGWIDRKQSAPFVKEYWRWHFNAEDDAGPGLTDALEANPTHESSRAVKDELQALVSAEAGIEEQTREDWRWQVFVARVGLDEKLSEIDTADKACKRIGIELRKAMKLSSKPQINKLLSDLVGPLKEREKLVEAFIKAADALQHDVYNIAPEREVAASGHQLATDTGRASLSDWISALERAGQQKGAVEIKDLLQAILDDLKTA